MLPTWIKKDLNGFFTLLPGCVCERCGITWWPRIYEEGRLNLNRCPDCKSKLWNKKK